ncbi:MAG TPA: hypothetical protein VGR41_09355 [Actinomycetota bacterium]|nr:hypothetical protein [Actinomycetota bacterium]
MNPTALRGRRTVALVVSIILLSSCSGSGKPHTTDPSPVPSRSASTTPSASPADEHCGYQLSSFDVSVHAQSGVGADELQDVRQGVRLAQDAYRAKIPTCEKGTIRVEVLERDRGSVAGQTLVQNAPDFKMQIFAKGAFGRTPSAFRPIVLLHEWYHVLQFALIDCGKGCLPLSEPVPDWLIEGAAVEESLSEAADLHISFYSFFRAGEIAQAERVEETLESLAKIRLPGDRYGLAFAAVELLVAQHGHGSLERLWARTGTTGAWQLAFRRTFEEPVARFYREFETYRANGFRA